MSHQNYVESDDIGGIEELTRLATEVVHRQPGWEDRLRMELESAGLRIEELVNILIQDKNPKAPTIQKYKRTPVTEFVEAVQLTRDNAIEVQKWCGGNLLTSIGPTPDGGMDQLSSIRFRTLDGDMAVAREGDYIIRKEDGFCMRNSDIFTALYEIEEAV